MQIGPRRFEINKKKYLKVQYVPNRILTLLERFDPFGCAIGKDVSGEPATAVISVEII